jgi:hypothetical protein
VHPSGAVTPQVAFGHRVPAVQQAEPFTFPHGCRGGGRIDDVDEEHGRQRPLVDPRGRRTGDQFLDLADESLDVADVGDVLVALEFDEARLRDVCSAR